MPIALVIPIALVVGVVIGALGAGGSIVTVPVLVYLLGQSPAAAQTGSLIVVGSAAAVGSLPHLRSGRARVREGLVFGVLGVAGAWIGTALAARVPGAISMTLFGLLMLLVAAIMARRLRTQGSAAGPSVAVAAPRPESPGAPTGRPPDRTVRLLPLILTATGVGVLTGFFGVGGGFAVVPALVLALGLPMEAAAGTSLIVITVNSLIALTLRLAHPVSVDWAVVGVFAGCAVVGGFAGGALAGRIPRDVLTRVFIALLVVVAVSVLVMAVPSLER